MSLKPEPTPSSDEIIFSYDPRRQFAEPGTYVQYQESGLAQQFVDPDVILANRVDHSPIQLNIDQDALFEWLEAQIEESFSLRLIALAEHLGLYDPSEDPLLSTAIHKKVLAAMKRTVAIADQDEPVSVLDLFHGNQDACKFGLWLGLSLTVKKQWRDDKKDISFCDAMFYNAGLKLSLTEQHIEQCLQIVNESNLLHSLLFPDDSIVSIKHELLSLFMNRVERQRLDKFLGAAAQALAEVNGTDAELNNFVPEGERLVNIELQVESSTYTYQQVIDILNNDPWAKLYFLMYILSNDSYRLIYEYLNYRLK